MPNRLTEVFERAADVLNENWAEANEFGDEIPCLYYPPLVNTAGEATEFIGVVDDLTTEDAIDEGTGTHREGELRERTSVDFRTSLLEALQEGTIEIPRYPGERFSIESIERDEQFTTLNVYRYSTQSIQRRGVERGR
jgi:hypothetical protein